MIVATLVNLGTGDVVFQPKHSAKICLGDKRTLSVTLRRCDFDEATWQTAIQGPVKFVTSQLFDQEMRDAIQMVNQRSFWWDHKVVPKEEANLLRFQVLVEQKDEMRFLRSSGMCKAFIQPKPDPLKPDQRFSIIWVPGDRVSVINRALAYPTHVGLANGQRGLGVRVSHDDFCAAWKLLRPDDVCPTHTLINSKWKLSPIQPEVTQADLVKIGESIGWPFRPIKKLGDSTWLVGAEKKPTFSSFAINNCAVLVTEYADDRRRVQQIHLAGPPAPSAHQASSSSGNPGPSTDPWMQHGDPWQSAKQATPNTVGPNAKKLSAQDERIDKLEHKILETQALVEKQNQENNAKFASRAAEGSGHDCD